MGSFKGRETFSIDSKGRLNIPAKMRKCIPAEAGNTFVVTRGLDKCISAYPHNEWIEKYEKKFDNLNQFDSNDRQFLRRMLEWSEDVELDNQQRIMLPKELLEYAGIDGKITLIGMLDHIEFWNPASYEEYVNNCEDSYEEIAEKVMTQPKNKE